MNGFAVHIDSSGDKIDKKIRNAQLDAYNFIGVVGPKEVENGTITLRRRGEEEPIGAFTIKETIEMFSKFTAPKSRKREEL